MTVWNSFLGWWSGNIQGKDIVTLVSLGLASTTLYVTQFRRGRLLVAHPRGVVIWPSGSETSGIWRLAVAVVNTGNLDRLVANMRLRIDHPACPQPLYVQRVVSQLQPSGTETGDLVTPWLIGARKAEIRICVFKGPVIKQKFTAGIYRCTIETRQTTTNRWYRSLTGWRPLRPAFDITVSEQASQTIRTGNLFMLDGLEEVNTEVTV